MVNYNYLSKCHSVCLLSHLTLRITFLHPSHPINSAKNKNKTTVSSSPCTRMLNTHTQPVLTIIQGHSLAQHSNINSAAITLHYPHNERWTIPCTL